MLPAQLAKCLLAIHHLTAFRPAKAMLNFGGNLGVIVSQPLFVLMEI